MKLSRIVKVFPAILFLFLLSVPNTQAQGHFEFGVHYSRWSVDILGNIIENIVDDALEDELRDLILDDIQEIYPDLLGVTYSQEVEFDSSGNNYGFEIRWYPGGYYGSFSIGLSVEKTSMKLEIPRVTNSLSLTENASFQGIASGIVEINPLSFHLSLRWDIVASSSFNPFLTLGFGFATFSSIEDDVFLYDYSGELSLQGIDMEIISGGEKKTIREIQDELEAEDEDFLPIGFLPFVRASIGLKGKLTENIHFLVDAGIFNGIIIRGGIAFRL